jgi:hypothetical protein
MMIPCLVDELFVGAPKFFVALSCLYCLDLNSEHNIGNSEASGLETVHKALIRLVDASHFYTYLPISAQCR